MKRFDGYFLGTLLTILILGCNSQQTATPQQTEIVPIVTDSPTLVVTPISHPLAISVQNVSSLKLEKIIGAGKVNNVAWSPQRDIIAVAQDFDILFYDSVSLQLIESIDFGGTEVVFSPDGNTISIIDESEVIVWDLTKKETSWNFAVKDVFAKHLAYNNQGSRLAFWGIYIYDAVAIYVLEVWDVNSGEQVYFEEEAAGSDVHVEFSPNDKLLAVHTDVMSKFVDLDTGEQKAEQSLWSRDAFAFLENNSYFGRTEEGQLAVMDVNTFEIARVLDIKIDYYASKFIVSPDKKKLLTFDLLNKALLSEDIQIWDLETEKQLFSIVVPNDFYIPQVEISPDSHYFVLVDGAGYVRKYDLLTGELVGQLEFTTEVSDVEFIPDEEDLSGYSILAGYWGGQVRDWNYEGQLIKKFEGHNNRVSGISVNSDYSRLVSAGDDFTAKIWDIKTGSLFRTLNCSVNNFVQMAMYSENGDFFVLECMGQIEIWDTKTWTQIDSMDGYDLQKLPPKNILVSSFPLGNDGKFTVTSILDKKKIYEFSLAEGYIVLNASFSPNGKMLAAADGQNTVIVWDMGNKTPKHYLLEEGMECTYMECQEQSVAFSPDGHLLASSSEDENMVRLWDVESGKQIMTLDLKNNVNIVTFSSDGRYLIAGCDDGRIYVWAIE
jgi:WD40 repeat protein